LRRAEGLLPQALWSDEGGHHQVLQWTSEYRELMVSTPRLNRLEIRTFFYPGWTARLNGKVVPLDTPIPPLHLLAGRVPPPPRPRDRTRASSPRRSPARPGPGRSP